MKFIKIILFSTIFFFLSLHSSIYAADYTITCNHKSCTTIDPYVFYQTNLSPGNSISKSIKVINTSKKNLDLTLNPTSTSSANLLEKIDIVTLNPTSSTYFTGTLKEFIDSSIDLKNIGAKTSREFQITADIQRIDNTFQGQQVQFNLDFNLNLSDPQNQTSPPTSNN